MQHICQFNSCLNVSFQASVKNFQLCHHSSPDYIIMQVDHHHHQPRICLIKDAKKILSHEYRYCLLQLGRIETNVFNMDFRWPFFLKIDPSLCKVQLLTLIAPFSPRETHLYKVQWLTKDIYMHPSNAIH